MRTSKLGLTLRLCSSLVGLAVMLILFFVPGRIAAVMSVAQKEKMKAVSPLHCVSLQGALIFCVSQTDSRVQLVSECKPL